MARVDFRDITGWVLPVLFCVIGCSSDPTSEQQALEDVNSTMSLEHLEVLDEVVEDAAAVLQLRRFL